MLSICLAIIETDEERSLFESIYHDYGRQMHRVACAILKDDILAEDAVQSAFLGIATQISQFHKFSENEMKAYVLTAAKHAALRLYNIEKKIRTNEISLYQIAPQPDKADTARDVIASDNASAILGAIGALPSTYREILLFRYNFNMNNEDIAIVLGKSRGAVRQLMRRARAALKAQCRKEGIILEG